MPKLIFLCQKNDVRWQIKDNIKEKKNFVYRIENMTTYWRIKLRRKKNLFFIALKFALNQNLKKIRKKAFQKTKNRQSI